MARAIITGVSEGLGYETAKFLLEKGWEVIGISRKQPSLDIVYLKADLTKESDLEKIIAEINNNYKEFDVLINCAGMLFIQPIDQIDYKELETLYKLNVLAPIKLTSGLINLIKSNEADIVNVGSTIGFKAYEDQCAYGSSKWAIRGVNLNLQTELQDTKCRVIGFNPGGFKSRIFEKATGTKHNLDAYMEVEDVAKFLVHTIELPKNMEVTEVILNRR